ncbi:MAG: hypothetical protein R3B82_15510 [Sandaracinaceae bacterium]
MRARLLLLSLLLGGCVLDKSGTRPSDDGGTPPGFDAAVLDAGAFDAGAFDAGGRDAGRVDAALPDASVCPSGSTACPGAGCVDIASDVQHCGGCGAICATPSNGAPTCVGGTCGVVCDVGFEAAGTSCVPSSCGDRVLDPGEACDDGDVMGGDGCSATCTMEMEASATCPGAEIWLDRGVQRYTGSTIGQPDVVSCGGTGHGPDALFTIHTSWTGGLRIRVHPRSGWDIVLNTRPECPFNGSFFVCEDFRGDGEDEQAMGPVANGGTYSVVVAGYRAADAGEFDITFESF